MQDKRIGWLDTMKGILVLFVILSHSYPAEIYRRFFTPFFLTMFFFGAGYFFSMKASFGKFIKNKLYHLALPLLLLGGIRMLVSCFLERDSLLLRFCGLFLQFNCRYDEMWFLSCLFVAELFFYGILSIAQRQGGKALRPQVLEVIVILGSALILLLAGYLDICIFHIRFPWEAEIACIMVFYLAAGYLYRRQEDRISGREKGIWPVILGVGGYLALILIVYCPADIHAEQFPRPVCFFVLSLVSMPLIIAVSKGICRAFPKSPLKFLGRNSLFYFAFGGFGRMIIYAVTDRLGITDEYIIPVICVFFSAVIMAVPACLVQTYAPWLVGQKKRKND